MAVEAVTRPEVCVFFWVGPIEMISHHRRPRCKYWSQFDGAGQDQDEENSY